MSEHEFVTEMREIITNRAEANRRTDAYALVSRFIDRLDNKLVALVDLRQEVVIPRVAFIGRGATRFATTCWKCKTMIQIGDPNWTRTSADGSERNVTLCVECYGKPPQ